ncbi:MAG: HAD family hydrolase [bacterium]|nr:HAD family hydrolase [bacterium]
MSKAVFMDRDNTIIEDPGYISDPDSVKLLPGVELAIKSLAQAGFKNIVCTNQSGVARGILTEVDLESIHAELRRQLADKGAHLDAIYYCPFHPQGTVEEYACESDLRKPKPGMLLKAAEDLDLELSQCWMVGDSPRDIEAGQRAGCRTIRVRVAGETSSTDRDDESVHADYTVRNLVEAARIIARETDRTGTWETPTPSAAVASVQPDPQKPLPQPTTPKKSSEEGDDATTNDQRVRMEILSLLRRLVRREEVEEFSFLKLAGGIVQMLALLTLLISVLCFLGRGPDKISVATLWAIISVALQVMSLTFFTIQRNK